LEKVSCLKRRTGALCRVELIEKDCVVLTILNVLAEIGDTAY